MGTSSSDGLNFCVTFVEHMAILKKKKEIPRPPAPRTSTIVSGFSKLLAIIYVLMCRDLPQIYQAFLMSATLSEDVKALKKMVLHNPVSYFHGMVESVSPLALKHVHSVRVF